MESDIGIEENINSDTKHISHLNPATLHTNIQKVKNGHHTNIHNQSQIHMLLHYES